MSVAFKVLSAVLIAAGVMTSAIAATTVDIVSRACEAEVRQIVLMDACAVLGWQRWREIEERHGLGRLKQALRLLADTGRIQEDMVNLFAHILLASLIEIAFVVARSPDPHSAAKGGRKAIKELLGRVLGTSRGTRREAERS